MPLRRLVLALLLLAPPASAGARAVGLGIGLELPPATLAEDADVDHEQRLVALELPVFAGRLRFAPALAYASGTEPSGGWTAEVTRLSLGAAVGWTFDPAENVRTWVGPRGGVVQRDLEGASGLVDGFVGGVLGGEVFLGKAVSLGADLRCTYTSLEQGRYTITRYFLRGTTTRGAPDRIEWHRGWSLTADAALSLRFYPW